MDPLEKRILLLPGLNKVELSEVWEKLFKTPAPPLQKPLLVRILAYRLQEQAYGGLSPVSRRRLLQLAEKIKATPKASLSDSPKIKPGTRLIREWNHRVHVVTVKDSSYEYGGSRYKSLSEVARLITGTQWSGPLFFGLKDKQKAISVKNERMA